MSFSGNGLRTLVAPTQNNKVTASTALKNGATPSYKASSVSFILFL